MAIIEPSNSAHPVVCATSMLLPTYHQKDSGSVRSCQASVCSGRQISGRRSPPCREAGDKAKASGIYGILFGVRFRAPVFLQNILFPDKFRYKKCTALWYLNCLSIRPSQKGIELKELAQTLNMLLAAEGLQSFRRSQSEVSSRYHV